MGRKPKDPALAAAVATVKELSKTDIDEQKLIDIDELRRRAAQSIPRLTSSSQADSSQPDKEMEILKSLIETLRQTYQNLETTSIEAGYQRGRADAFEHTIHLYREDRDKQWNLLTDTAMRALKILGELIVSEKVEVAEDKEPKKQ